MSATFSEAARAWDTWAAMRRRTFLFLVFAAIYVSFQVVFQFADYTFFGAMDWFPFEVDDPTWYELAAQWFLTWLCLLLAALAVWLVSSFLLNDALDGPAPRFRILTHRRLLFVLMFLGLTCCEIGIFLGIDPERVEPSDYLNLIRVIATHAAVLLGCAILAGPELQPVIDGILAGPIRLTWIGKALRWLMSSPEPDDLHPEWKTREGRRRRLLIFLILAGLYVSTQVIFRWAEYPLFRADAWYYFGREGPSWFESCYRWFLTLLPVAAWGAIIFLVLTRYSFWMHRRVAFFLLLAGLLYFEADMRWFRMSRKHVTLTEIKVFLTVDATRDLGLNPSDYAEFALFVLKHAAALAICLLLAGPELKTTVRALWDGPLGGTVLGKTCSAVARWRWPRTDRALGWLGSRPALAAIAGCVLIDPIIIWALDKQEADLEESQTVVRELAETNPLRWHSLDRAWDSLVFPFSEEAQDIEAANHALDRVEPAASGTSGLFVANRAVPEKPDNVLVIQVESLSATVFADTDLPFSHAFAKKCLRLKNHYSVANCTHYGVLGLLRANPVTYYCGGLKEPVPSPYLDAFKTHGFKTRLISMWIMGHHYLGEYIPNWTEPYYEAGNDWACIPVLEEEFAKPGPRMAYLFYHMTHYPYRHQPQYNKYQPETPDNFKYNRSNLNLYRDQILNRYKNSLLEFDDWLRHVIAKVDLSRTIVVITGDHGEELLEQGRLGHCSSLNVHQTMTPCLVYVPGVPGADVTFTTSNADLLPSIADALGWDKKNQPKVLGRSIFRDVPFRYAIVSSFEYKKALRWAMITDDRKAIVERDSDNNLDIVKLVDWQGRRLTYRDEPERWINNFKIVREVEAELKRYGL